MASDNNAMKYKFSKVKDPFFKDNEFMAQNKRPLEEQFVEAVSKDLEWSDFLWGERSVIVKGVNYDPLMNYKYYAIQQ